MGLWQAGAVLASTGIVLVPLALALARRIAPRHGVFFARWGFSHVALLFCGAVILLSLTPLLVPATLSEEGAGSWIPIARTMVLMGGLAGGVLYLAHKLDPDGIAALGLARGGNLRAIGAGVLCFALLWPVFAGFMMFWPDLASVLDIEIGVQPVLESILALEGPVRVAALLFAIVIGPLFEELIFRGFLQPLLVQNFREGGGIFLCALLFALLHGADVFLPLFMFSLLLGWLQVHTHRILASYCVHVLNNGVTLAIAFTIGL